MATYLYARADWDATKIQKGDIAPFTDVTGLTFGVNAFNSTDGIVSHQTADTVEAFFATCAENESYGEFLEHHSLKVTTKAYKSYATANFDSIDIEEWGEKVADLDFECAAVKFVAPP